MRSSQTMFTHWPYCLIKWLFKSKPYILTLNYVQAKRHHDWSNKTSSDGTQLWVTWYNGHRKFHFSQEQNIHQHKIHDNLQFDWEIQSVDHVRWNSNSDISNKGDKTGAGSSNFPLAEWDWPTKQLDCRFQQKHIECHALYPASGLYLRAPREYRLNFTFLYKRSMFKHVTFSCHLDVFKWDVRNELMQKYPH